MAAFGKCQCTLLGSLGGGLGLGGTSRRSPAAAPRQGGDAHYTRKPHASAWRPPHPGRGRLRGCSREGGGWPRGGRQRARLGRGRGRRRCCPGGGGRREGAATAAAAASPAATQTPGAAEAVSRSACPRLLGSQSGVGVAAGAGVRGAVAPGAAVGGTQRLPRGGRRGGHVESAGLGTCPYSPSRIQFTLSIPRPSPHVSEGKENKTKDPENGWQKRREQLCRGTRRGARGWQDGGALGRKGAFESLASQGPPEHPSPARGGVQDTRWFPGLRTRP